MFLIAAMVLIISMILVLFRLYLGPTLYDRVLASNVFGTQTVLFIESAFSDDRPCPREGEEEGGVSGPQLLEYSVHRFYISFEFCCQ